MYKTTCRCENRTIHNSKKEAKNCNAEKKEQPKYAEPIVCLIYRQRKE